MIKNVHCEELRQVIANTIKPLIKKHRSKKENEFYGTAPTDDEIDDFIISTPYFDDMIKDFLLSGNGYWLLDDEDVKEFRNNLKSWVKSHDY
jgi:hypothetical protein